MVEFMVGFFQRVFRHSFLLILALVSFFSQPLASKEAKAVGETTLTKATKGGGSKKQGSQGSTLSSKLVAQPAVKAVTVKLDTPPPVAKGVTPPPTKIVAPKVAPTQPVAKGATQAPTPAKPTPPPVKVKPAKPVATPVVKAPTPAPTTPVKPTPPPVKVEPVKPVATPVVKAPTPAPTTPAKPTPPPVKVEPAKPAPAKPEVKAPTPAPTTPAKPTPPPVKVEPAKPVATPVVKAPTPAPSTPEKPTSPPVKVEPGKPVVPETVVKAPTATPTTPEKPTSPPVKVEPAKPVATPVVKAPTPKPVAEKEAPKKVAMPAKPTQPVVKLVEEKTDVTLEKATTAEPVTPVIVIPDAPPPPPPAPPAPPPPSEDGKPTPIKKIWAKIIPSETSGVPVTPEKPTVKAEDNQDIKKLVEKKKQEAQNSLLDAVQALLKGKFQSFDAKEDEKKVDSTKPTGPVSSGGGVPKQTDEEEEEEIEVADVNKPESTLAATLEKEIQEFTDQIKKHEDSIAKKEAEIKDVEERINQASKDIEVQEQIIAKYPNAGPRLKPYPKDYFDVLETIPDNKRIKEREKLEAEYSKDPNNYTIPKTKNAKTRSDAETEKKRLDADLDNLKALKKGYEDQKNDFSKEKTEAEKKLTPRVAQKKALEDQEKSLKGGVVKTGKTFVIPKKDEKQKEESFAQQLQKGPQLKKVEETKTEVKQETNPLVALFMKIKIYQAPEEQASQEKEEEPKPQKLTSSAKAEKDEWED